MPCIVAFAIRKAMYCKFQTVFATATLGLVIHPKKSVHCNDFIVAQPTENVFFLKVGAAKPELAVSARNPSSFPKLCFGSNFWQAAVDLLTKPVSFNPACWPEFVQMY